MWLPPQRPQSNQNLSPFLKIILTILDIWTTLEYLQWIPENFDVLSLANPHPTSKKKKKDVTKGKGMMIIREPECQLWYFSEEDGADAGEEKKGETGTESAGDSSKAPDIDLPPETRQVNGEDEITKYIEKMGIVEKFSCRGRDSPIPTSLYQFIKHH